MGYRPGGCLHGLERPPFGQVGLGQNQQPGRFLFQLRFGLESRDGFPGFAEVDEPLRPIRHGSNPIRTVRIFVGVPFQDRNGLFLSFVAGSTLSEKVACIISYDKGPAHGIP